MKRGLAQGLKTLLGIGGIDGIRRVRYTSPHPKDMTPDVFEAMAETPAVVPHLHFPLQSGSDSILKAMHRGYMGDRYLEKLAAARATGRRGRAPPPLRPPVGGHGPATARRGGCCR